MKNNKIALIGVVAAFVILIGSIVTVTVYKSGMLNKSKNSSETTVTTTTTTTIAETTETTAEETEATTEETLFTVTDDGEILGQSVEIEIDDSTDVTDENGMPVDTDSPDSSSNPNMPVEPDGSPAETTAPPPSVEVVTSEETNSSTKPGVNELPVIELN